MARLNAELDDDLHRRFVAYAQARGITMRQILQEFIEGLTAAPAPDVGAQVIEIHLGVGVRTHFDRDEQRVHVYATGQWRVGVDGE